MKYTIIKLCCKDCKHFESVYFTDDDYIDYISRLKDYADYYFLVFSNNKFFTEFEGWDI